MAEQKTIEQRIEEIALLNDASREYEVLVSNLVRSKAFDVDEAQRVMRVNLDRANAATSDNGHVLLARAYAAFYCVNTYRRAVYDRNDLNDVWNAYRGVFSQFQSLSHLEVLRALAMVSEQTDVSESSRYLAVAERNAVGNPTNAGYQHAFADLYATVVEMDDRGASDHIVDEWHQKALSAVDTAICLDSDYAKYYCTKGRILSIGKDFASADRAIQKAIDKENSSHTDYAMKVARYQYYRLQNQASRQSSEIEGMLQEQQKRVDNLSSSVVTSVETVAIFSGIVSFALGSLSLANGQTAVHAGLLIITLMGALVAALSLFTFLLRISSQTYNKVPAIVCAVMGLVVAVAATICSGVL